MVLRGGGADCRRCSMEPLLRRQRASGCKKRPCGGRMQELRPPLCQGAGPDWRGVFRQEETISPSTEQGKVAVQGRDRRRVAADEAATHHRGAGALPYRRGSRDRRRTGIAGTANPNDRRILAFNSLTRSWVSGLYVKVAAWRVRQWNQRSRKGATRKDLVDLCLRRTLGATAGCRGGFLLPVSLIT